MNRQMFEVMQRRGELLAKIASQREQAAQIGTRWEAPLAFADKCRVAVHFLRSRPILVASAVTLLVVRKRGLVGLARGGWRVWRGYSYIVALSARLLPRN